MSHRGRVAALPCAAVLIGAGLLAPATASAHGLTQRFGNFTNPTDPSGRSTTATRNRARVRSSQAASSRLRYFAR